MSLKLLFLWFSKNAFWRLEIGLFVWQGLPNGGIENNKKRYKGYKRYKKFNFNWRFAEMYWKWYGCTFCTLCTFLQILISSHLSGIRHKSDSFLNSNYWFISSNHQQCKSTLSSPVLFPTPFSSPPEFQPGDFSSFDWTTWKFWDELVKLKIYGIRPEKTLIVGESSDNRISYVSNLIQAAHLRNIG